MFKSILALFRPSKTAKAKAAAPTVAQTNRAGVASAATPPVSNDTLPAITDPVWQRLVERKIPLETSNYALQMLLSWASNLQASHSEAEIANRIKVVHLFFKKNQHQLKSEVQQVLGA